MLKVGRVLVVAAVLAVLVAACSGSGAEPPPIDGATQAVLSVSAVDIGCTECRNRPIFVRNQLITSDTLVGEEQPMPQQVRDDIAAMFPDATFVSRAEENALFVDGVVANDGVIVYVGPLEELSSDVVGVPIGRVTARDGAKFVIVQFKWNGDSWEHATSEDTGITVTTAVS